MALLILLPVLAASIVGCGFLGFAIERLAYRPLRRSSRLSALITAIGISLFLENAAQLLFGANPKFFRDGAQVTPRGAASTLNLFGVILSKDQLVLVCAAAIMMAGLWYVVQRTKTGRAMRAVAHDYDAAALMGINVDSVISFTFALGAALAGAAGMLFIAFSPVKVDPLIGIAIGLKAFVAAVVGGIGSIPGAVLGGLLMGISESFIRGSKFSGWTDAVAFTLLIVVLLARPAGILGKFAPEKV
jgi:branched-chain amino acid transport system permease protein